MENNLALIIEDDKNLGELFVKALRGAGFQAEHIMDGSSAIVRLSEMVPAIVVLDLNLPYVSGLGILAQIRADKRLTETRVIVATGDEQKADSPLRGLADVVLLKPVGYRQLRELATSLTSEER